MCTVCFRLLLQGTTLSAFILWFSKKEKKPTWLSCSCCRESAEGSSCVFIWECNEYCWEIFPSLSSSLLTLVCWWLTVQQLCDLRSSESVGCAACCRAADVPAYLGSDLLSEAVKMSPSALTGTAYRDICILHFLHVCLCFPICRPWRRENTCQSNVRRGTSWLFNVRRKHTATFYIWVKSSDSHSSSGSMCSVTEKFRFQCLTNRLVLKPLGSVS